MEDEKYHDANGNEIPSIVLNPDKFKGFHTFEGHPLEDLLSQERKPSIASKIALGALPAIGGALGGIPGAGLGGVASVELRNEFPHTFGKPPEDLEDLGGDVGGDMLFQGAIPAGIGKVATAALNPRNTMLRMLTSKIASKFPAMQRGLEGAESQGAQQGLDKLLEPQFVSKFGDNAQREIDFARGGMKPQMTLPEATATEKLIGKGYSKVEGKFDPKAILKELESTHEDYADISPETRSNISSLLTSLKEPAKNTTGESILRYSKGRLALGIPTAVAGFLTGHGLATTGAAGALYLTDSMLGKLMSNPELAQVVLQASKTPINAPEAGFLSKIIEHAVRGGIVAAQASQ